SSGTAPTREKRRRGSSPSGRPARRSRRRARACSRPSRRSAPRSAEACAASRAHSQERARDGAHGAGRVRSIDASLPRWRRPLLVLLALGTLASTAMIPRLRAVFAPEELVPARAEDAARVEALLGPFGGDDAPLL